MGAPGEGNIKDPGYVHAAAPTGENSGDTLKPYTGEEMEMNPLLMGLMGGGGSSMGFPQPPSSGRQALAQAQEDSYIFKSPLTLLETIRTVSNIVVGATRNFDNLFDSFKDESMFDDQIIQDVELTAIPDFDTTVG